MYQPFGNDEKTVVQQKVRKHDQRINANNFASAFYVQCILVVKPGADFQGEISKDVENDDKKQTGSEGIDGIGNFD